MRSLLILCVLARVAAADAKADVAALVDKHFHASMGDGRPDDDRAAVDEALDTKDAITPGIQPMEPFGYRVWGDAPNGEHPKMVGLYHTIKATRVVVDATNHTAYFTADIDAAWTSPPPESKEQHTAVRAIGVAVQRGKTWKLVAVDYARTLPDAELWKLVDAKLVAPTPPWTESAPVPSLIAAWFDGKAPAPIEKDRAPIATALARGTSPGESASGAAADKLVKQWDAIKMFQRGRVGGGHWGDTYYARCDVAIPHKGGAVPLELRAIFVKDGAAWRWVVLDFAPPVPQ